ncbi:MAG: GNAT family N-acetyltransferase [Gammaproteobacteria bacterium]|nr:GNAT family N-acetyltransferase [Gammaproteobacteria bacterium]MBU2184988.1 GNAT family N-acetyltransferase [Gammaproteobacteria bacterium]MBU2203714.1 GNAT family N-acetyltransferase [Gammaproteobacteria bacterium]
MQLLPLSENDFSAVISLANQVHGDNYLDTDRLQQMYQQGIKQQLNASFVAVDTSGAVVGYRLSFAPGQWQLDSWCSTVLWSVPVEQMAYFKSVAVAASMRGKGVASALLKASAQVLAHQGARAGLAHIWRESPGNAAERYFSYAGARLLKVHPQRWRHLSVTAGYICPLCGNLCNCSAAEMELLFKAFADV